jgi:hypothetical protein
MEIAGQNNKQKIIGFFIGVIVIILVFIVYSFQYRQDSPERVYTYVSIDRVIATINQEMAKKSLERAEMAEIVGRAKGLFEREVKEYSVRNNAVVFSSVRVIAGASDITEEIAKKVVKELGL